MIYDINGKKVLRQKAYYGNNVINMTLLKAGVYSVLFWDKNKKIGSYKFVKQ